MNNLLLPQAHPFVLISNGRTVLRRICNSLQVLAGRRRHAFASHAGPVAIWPEVRSQRAAAALGMDATHAAPGGKDPQRDQVQIPVSRSCR